MQGKDTERENDPHNTHCTHTSMAHFVPFVCSSVNKCHFTLEDENFLVKENNSNLTLLIEIWL